MGTVKESSHDNSIISHGICDHCRDNVRFQQGVTLQSYIDSLAIPIFVIDDKGVVQTVNNKACQALGKNPADIVHHLGGDVFECEHARLPGGCGKTIHCSGCSIRRAVTECYNSGEPKSMVPACVNPETPSAVELMITTIRVNDGVLLRIDRMKTAAAQR